LVAFDHVSYVEALILSSPVLSVVPVGPPFLFLSGVVLAVAAVLEWVCVVMSTGHWGWRRRRWRRATASVALGQPSVPPGWLARSDVNAVVDYRSYL